LLSRNRFLRHYRIWGVLLFLGFLFAVIRATGLRDHLTLAYVHDQFMAHELQGLLLFTLLFCVGNLAQIPGLIFLAAAVLALGKLWGGLATLLAAVVSCALTFVLIRLLGGNALRQVPGKWIARLLDRLDAHPVQSIFWLRVLLQTLPAINYTLALSGVRFRDYMLGTVLGLPLPIAVYCLFFDSLARLLHLPAY
jgi:uncharacterized membrane protein YdjX (TVP38/TMEM64 family)